MQINNFKLHFVTSILIPLFAIGLVGQDTPKNPDRGAKVGNAYSMGDFEVINTTNGNLTLNFPLGSLPKGRGSVGGGVSLTYNSKLWDIGNEKIEDFRGSPYPPFFDKTIVKESTTGGWTIFPGVTSLEIEDRREQFSPNWPSCPNGQGDDVGLQMTYIYKVRVVMPDGRKHEMIPNGYSDTPSANDGFYKVSPDGWIENCGGSRSRTGGSVVYRSIDGSFLRLEFSYDSDDNAANNTWMLYFPDGSRYNGSRLWDKNGNYVDYSYTGVTDQLARSVTISTDGNGDTLVTSDGVAGEDIVWRVKWKYITVGKTYQSCEGPRCTSTHLRSDLSTNLKVVHKIVQPEQMGSGEYVFSYNAYDQGTSSGESYGWGEISEIELPSGATVHYDYVMDDEDGPTYLFGTRDILKNYPDTKTLTHDLEYDGSTSSTSETTTYSITSGGSTVTHPDGSTSQEVFGITETGGTTLPWDTGLSYRSVSPNGSKVEKIWAKNIPSDCGGYACLSSMAINPYVDIELTSIKDANGDYTLTAIKDFAYDKNGNITEVKEYDWVPYSSVPRTSTLPTGMPSGVSSYLKRISQTEFYAATPDATSSTYTDADSYHLASSPRLLRLPKAMEVLDSSSTPKSRSEMVYDYTDYSSSNTVGGNLTQTKAWDSTKAAYSNPLTSTNWITTSATYNSYGMPLTSTDANGNVTQLTYGSISGVSNLYPTQTVAAYGTGLARTTTSTYDYYTGLLTSTTDEDNDVTNAVEYDDLGRPVKSITAQGTSLESWTSTTYNDALRRVIVKSDLETKDDRKKVATQFFDQLGRERLSKTLEDASYQSATNETDGIKVQSRYKTVSGYTYQLTGTSKNTSSKKYKSSLTERGKKLK